MIRRFPTIRPVVTGVAGTVLATGLVASAAAQTHWGVDTSVGAGISTNPYFQTGTSSVSATGTVDVRPSLTVQRPLTNLTLSGDANLAYYSQYGNTNESFSLNGAVDHRLSERTTLNGSLNYLNSIIGTFNDVRIPVGEPIVETALPVYVNDPTLAGLGRRRQSYQASAGIGTALSPRDRVSVNVSASANRFGGLAFSDFNYWSPNASYSRAVGDGFNVGASMSVGFTNYLGTQTGDATVYQPQVTASRRLNGSLTLDLSAGAGIATVRNANGVDTSSTAFNGSASLCRRDQRWNACLSASRQTLPSAYQGVRTQTSLSASGGYRIGPRDDLSVSINYSRAGAPVQENVIGARAGSVDYLSATGNLSHRLGKSLSGFVSAGINNSFNDGVSRNANFTAQLGVSYRFTGR